MAELANSLAGLDLAEVLTRGRILIAKVSPEVMKVVHGKEMFDLLQCMVKAMICNGHILIRGGVGEGKTLLSSCFAATVQGVFRKTQFTPDMQPNVLKGTKIFNPKTGEWEVKHGLIYGANIVLVDEINRGPAKTQSALLEVMEERHITIEGEVFYLSDEVFLVVANRNPIEHTGVYELPEAQRDRFLMQLLHKGSSKETVLEILADQDNWRFSRDLIAKIIPVVSPAEIATLREAIFTSVYVDPRIDDYIARLREVTACYKIEVKQEVPQPSGSSLPWQKRPDLVSSPVEGPNVVAYGVSPRGAKELRKLARVNAFLAGRDYVLPEDVWENAVDCWAHRVFFDSRFAGRPDLDLSGAKVIRRVFKEVSVEQEESLFIPKGEKHG